jgi:hypothetical protein
MNVRRAGRGSLLLTACGLVSLAGLAAVPGVTTRRDSLRQTPAASAKVVTVLPAGANVGMAERRGFWQRVESPTGNGWLKLASVRSLSGKADTAGLAALATGRGMTGNIVSSSGARGLSAEDLVEASANTETLAALETWGVAEQEARQFAGDGELVARKLPYLRAEQRR